MNTSRSILFKWGKPTATQGFLFFAKKDTFDSKSFALQTNDSARDGKGGTMRVLDGFSVFHSKPKFCNQSVRLTVVEVLVLATQNLPLILQIGLSFGREQSGEMIN